MTTVGEQVGNYSEGLGSEDLSEVVCDPCQDDGELIKAVGMCINCHDFLCKRCYDGHRIARPFRKHKLLDKQEIQQSQLSLKRKDQCTEQCAVHEDDVIKYYCLNHSQLGCGVCVTLDHKLCDRVTYIPQAANDLTNNEEYQQAKNQLNSVMERSKQLAANYKQKTESLEKCCLEAVKMIHDYRRELNEALDKIEVDLIEICKTLKLEETKKIAQFADRSKTALADLYALIAKVEAYQNNKQNCNLYTAMMKTKDTLKIAKDTIQEAENGLSSLNNQVHFVANKDTLNKLRHVEVFGEIVLSGASNVFQSEETGTNVGQTEQTAAAKKEDTRTNVNFEYVQDINIRSKSDKRACYISGMVGLSNNRMIVTDFKYKEYGNGNIKLVDINCGEVITHLTLSSVPWDAAKVNSSQLVVTLPCTKKLVFVSVAASVMNVDSTLDVDGECRGVDYSDGKLAVSFRSPHKVQVLTLQGEVMHTITTDKQGQPLFKFCNYVTFGQDTTSLFVSNYNTDSVMHVKFDGTVVSTYTDKGFRGPLSLLTDSSGNVYMCGKSSNSIHQITPDCKKIKQLLTIADELFQPYSISFNETESRLCVGTLNNDVIKEYRVVLGIK